MSHRSAPRAPASALPYDQRESSRGYMDQRMFWGHFEPQGVTGIPSLMNNYATIAADGSVGFSTASNVASLWVNPTDVSSFFVGVIEVPAPGARPGRRRHAARAAGGMSGLGRRRPSRWCGSVVIM
jgi:hypothetical protein